MSPVTILTSILVNGEVVPTHTKFQLLKIVVFATQFVPSYLTVCPLVVPVGIPAPVAPVAHVAPVGPVAPVNHWIPWIH